MKITRSLAGIVALAVALGGVLFTAPPAQSAELVTVIDDAKTGKGDGQFDYGSGWSTSTGLDTSRWQDGTEHWTNGTSSFTLRFTGTAVRLFGVTAPGHGIAAVSIDGGPEVLADSYAATRSYKQLLFESPTLADGTHTLTYRVTGDKNAASTGIGVSIDAAEVVAPEPTEIVGGIVDDATTSGPHRFTYGTGWVAGTGNSTTNYHNGTEHWAKPAGTPSFTFTFTGVLATLHGVTAPEHGRYGVSVDGGAETVVDGYSSGRLFKQQVFSTGLLPYGEHTVTLRLTGDKNPAASRADGQIDFATVYTENVPVTGVELDAAPLRLLVGQQSKLSAKVLPEGAIERGIRWSSSDEAIATIAADGTVTATAEGEAELTATTVDGGKTATRRVQVVGIGSGLHGVVGDTNFHYVDRKTFDDYERKYYEDVVQMTGTTWSATAWRGDRVNGQFVFRTGTEAQSDVTLAASALTGPGGASIPAEEVTLDVIRTVLAGQGNPSAGRPQERVPDVLGGNAPFDLAPRSVQGVWMTVDVPTGTAPGNYTGTVTATSAEGAEIAFELQLEVLRLTLPEPSEWEQFIDLWQNPYAIARVEGIPTDQLWTKAHFDAMRPYYRMLADGGQDVITTTVVADPWASQTYDKYGSMVQWTKQRDGSWAFDFSAFDAWVEYMIDDIGIDGQIDAYSMVNWASRILYYDEASGQNVNAKVDVGTAQWNAMWGAFLEAFGPHLKEKGWFDRTYMAMDERALGDIIKAVDLIAEKAPGLKVGAAMNYNSLADPRLDRIEKISLGSYYVDLGDAEFAEVSAHRRELGLITSVYSCVGHFPNTFTRSNPAEGDWVQWKTVATGSDGFLRWAFDSFVADPLQTTDFKTWESGDTAQIYPGALSSIRWEKLTEGARDAEKIRILRKASPEASATLTALMAGMENPGYASDPFGGRIDPGVVDIPAVVTALRATLDETARAYAATIPVPVEQVTVDPGALALTVGQQGALTATVLPVDASDPAVSWASSDKTVASVAAVGATATVTALAEGTATITVTSADGGKTATATVTVEGAEPELPDFTIALPGGAALVAGAEARIVISGLAPESEVEVELHSDPVRLAAGTADASGVFAATVTVPADTPAGAHALVVHGTDAEGTTGSRQLPVTVRAATGEPGGPGQPGGPGTPGGSSRGDGDLASTGAAGVGELIAAAILLAALGAALVLRRHRRMPRRG